jgi:hypothetical protein
VYSACISLQPTFSRNKLPTSPGLMGGVLEWDALFLISPFKMETVVPLKHWPTAKILHSSTTQMTTTDIHITVKI